MLSLIALNCFALGTLKVESLKALPDTDLQLEKYDADGKLAPLLIVKTNLESIQFQNVSRPTKHAPVYDKMHGYWKCYLNVSQRSVEIGAPAYETIQVNLLNEYGIDVKEKRCYELILQNFSEHETIPFAIISDPPDAEKWVDGVNLGTASSFPLTIGEHKLLLQKDGFKVLEQIIKVTKETPLINMPKMQGIKVLPIIVKSNPTGASIYINNQLVGETDKELFYYPGKYTLKLTRSSYLDWEQNIEIKENGANTFSGNLIKNTGFIDLTVNPSDAKVKVNGSERTERRLELPPSLYEIEVSKPEYLSKKETVNLKLGETQKLDFALTKNTGIINLTISPHDAQVIINGSNYNTQRAIELAPGKYNFDVEMAGYYPQTEKNEIALGGVYTKNITLQQITGGLQFSVTPLDATVVLMKGDESIQNWTGVKTITNLQIGKYTVQAKAVGYKTKTVDVLIEENKTTTLDLHLVKGRDVPEGFVLVEGGSFISGTSKVTVSSFFLSKYEVTQLEWKAVMGNNPSSFKSNINLPVENVSWFNAIEYCNRRSMNEGLTMCYSYDKFSTDIATWPAGWNKHNDKLLKVSCNWTANGYRLPTESEWEYAARGGNQTHNYKYSGSNDINTVAWYDKNSLKITHPVGKKLANELGLFDMSGNVYEWCWDICWEGYGYYPPLRDQSNPHGYESGNHIVSRGGSWRSYYGCDVLDRGGSNATEIANIFGFRVCRIAE